MIRVAICHPIDPFGHVPSGIDSFIRGILKFAPEDIEYTLFGASSDISARPLDTKIESEIGDRKVNFWPIVQMDPNAGRSRIPLILRYMRALRRFKKVGALAPFDVIDFHRIEPVLNFYLDPRPMNVLLHQDMSVIRDQDSDILWRHWPSLYEFIESRLLVRMRRIWTVRQSAVARYASIYPNLADRVRFIPTWVDTDVFYPSRSYRERQDARISLRNRLGQGADSEILVFVGRLDQQKDPLLLLSAFQLCAQQRRNVQLVVIGDGVLRESVRMKIAQDGTAAQVHLLGVQPALEIAKVLRGSDVFALSSAYEGMPIAVLEALATGIPVVSTDVGEVRLAIQSGTNGVIAGERTPQSFAGAITQALDFVGKLSGDPCVAAVAQYAPLSVLSEIFNTHRAEFSATAAARR